MLSSSSRHTWSVLGMALLDAVFFVLALLAASVLRFGEEWAPVWSDYWFPMVVGAILLPILLYITGLYGGVWTVKSRWKVAAKVVLAVGCCYVALFALFYFDFSSRIGRGVMLIAGAMTLLLVLLHHYARVYRHRYVREHLALFLAAESRELDPTVLRTFLSPGCQLAGYFGPERPSLRGVLVHLGTLEQAPATSAALGIERVLCHTEALANPLYYRDLCHLRYSGVKVQPLVALCEEVHHSVPLALITPDWLVSAASVPQLLYIKKLKRLFDVLVSVFGLVVMGPFLLVGMLLVRLTSKGPIFYRQVRVGRGGQLFSIIKLRTMRVDAEAQGAVWATKGKDPRVTPVGDFLRKYRIDEIPQIFNVLSGEMSFVGPRPERPEFVAKLDAEIPFNGERLLIQPGITGWAQVNYPYGASMDDARRKLEYDLYYLKHMGVFLDLFILLDTVRIVLRGGMSEQQAQERTAAARALGQAQVTDDTTPAPTASAVGS